MSALYLKVKSKGKGKRRKFGDRELDYKHLDVHFGLQTLSRGRLS